MKFRIVMLSLAIGMAPLHGMEQPSQNGSKIALKVPNLNTEQAEADAKQISIPENVQTVHDMAQALCKEFQNSNTQTQYSLERQEVVTVLSDKIKDHDIAPCAIANGGKFKVYDNRTQAFAAEVLLRAGKSVCSHYLSKDDYLSTLSIELLLPVIKTQIDTCSSLQDALKIITHLKELNKAYYQSFENTDNDLMQAIIKKINLKKFPQEALYDALYHYVVTNPNAWFVDMLLQLGARDSKSILLTKFNFDEQQWKETSKVIELLLERPRLRGSMHLYINQKDQDGYTPLHLAAKCHNVQAIKLLLDNGANVEVYDKNNFSPLHWAMTSGKDHLSSAATIIQLLIDKGAKFDAPYKDGSTALHLACEWGYEPIVRVLRNAGADMDKKNLLGYTPADCQLLYQNKKKESVTTLPYQSVTSLLTAHPKKVATFAAGGLLLAGLGYYYLHAQPRAHCLY